MEVFGVIGGALTATVGVVLEFYGSGDTDFRRCVKIEVGWIPSTR